MAAKPSTAKERMNGPRAKDIRAKRKALDDILSRLENGGASEKRLMKLANCLVDPQHAQPVVFPSPVPGRAGCAHFPYEFEISGAKTALPSDSFGMIVKPDISEPLRVTYLGSGLAYHTGNLSGEVWHAGGSKSQGYMDDGSYDDRACDIVAERIGDHAAFRLLCNADIGYKFSISNFVNYTNNRTVTLTLDTYNGSWSTPAGSTVALDTGVPDATVAAVPTMVAATTAFTFNAKDDTGYPVTCSFGFTLIRQSGGSWSCAPSGNFSESVMELKRPANWDGLLNASRHAKIVAQSLLVTYVGATLENAGGIAVCNSSQPLTIDSDGTWYSTVASQPFDVHTGRLASSGEQEGGAHWHYVPDDPRALILGSVDQDADRDLMTGYVGIRGMDVAQTIRVRMDIVVNFFSVDPSYDMRYQPAYAGYSDLIHMLRTEVALVSSNDSHLSKVAKAARAVAHRAFEFGRENPALVASALRAISTLL